MQIVRSLLFFVSLLSMGLALFSCQSLSKGFGQDLSFAEFQKVLEPRSEIIPLTGGEESLLLLSLPEDAYPKIYSMNHKTHAFTLKYDAGRAIGGLVQDSARKNIYFYLDENGDENHQIYHFDLAAGKARKVFAHNNARARIVDNSKDGGTLYIISNHLQKAAYHIYKLDVETGKFTALTTGKMGFDDALVSPKQDYMVLTRSLGNNELQVYLMNLKNKSMRRIFAKKKTIYQPSFFDPEGEYFYMNSDESKDRMGCALVRVKNPKLEWVKTNEHRDIYCNYDAYSDISSLTSIYDGRIQTEVFKGIYKVALRMPFPDKSLVTQFKLIPGTTKAVVKISASDSPGDFYVVDLNLHEKQPLQKISNLNRSKIEEFANSYDFYYESFDGRKIHSIFYAKPDWVLKTEKRPVILWPHGGPDSQEFHIYHPFFQYWVQKGYVVLAPNFRGSTGYGKEFETLNDGDWGGGHIKDLIYAKQAFTKLGFVNADEIYLVGGSFGGFSTLSAITQYPGEFKKAVAIVALANLFTFLKSIPPDPAWQAEFRQEVGDPVKDKKLLEERSPIFHAAKIKTPLKIYQAENDVRTVKAEMDAFVEELKKHSVPHEYEVLANEGHGLERAESREKVMQGTVEFLRKE